MKNRLSTLAIIIAVTALSACTSRHPHPQFTEIAIDTLLGSENSGCKVSYRFASISNASSNATLKAIEQSNINYFFELEEFSGTAPEAVSAALQQLIKDLGIPQDLPPDAARAWGQSEISVESEGAVIDTLLSYVITRSSYTGGAHGNYGTECHTYSLPGGYEVTTADLFSPEQLDKLNALIHTKIYEQFNAKDNEGLAEKGFFPEYIGVTENFRVTPEGITFCYNPYEIGCYALGDIEVVISSEELKAM